MMYYLVYYYVNTLTRGSPFFVGMIFGYLLHLGREEKFVWTKVFFAFVIHISNTCIFKSLYNYVEINNTKIKT